MIVLDKLSVYVGYFVYIFLLIDESTIASIHLQIFKNVFLTTLQPNRRTHFLAIRTMSIKPSVSKSTSQANSHKVAKAYPGSIIATSERFYPRRYSEGLSRTCLKRVRVGDTMRGCILVFLRGRKEGR